MKTNRRPFIKSDLKHTCGACSKPIMPQQPYRRDSAIGFICEKCVREQEIIHKPAMPGTKQAAMPA